MFKEPVWFVLTHQNTRLSQLTTHIPLSDLLRFSTLVPLTRCRVDSKVPGPLYDHDLTRRAPAHLTAHAHTLRTSSRLTRARTRARLELACAHLATRHVCRGWKGKRKVPTDELDDVAAGNAPATKQVKLEPTPPPPPGPPSVPADKASSDAAAARSPTCSVVKTPDASSTPKHPVSGTDVSITTQTLSPSLVTIANGANDPAFALALEQFLSQMTAKDLRTAVESRQVSSAEAPEAMISAGPANTSLLGEADALGPGPSSALSASAIRPPAIDANLGEADPLQAQLDANRSAVLKPFAPGGQNLSGMEGSDTGAAARSSNQTGPDEKVPQRT